MNKTPTRIAALLLVLCMLADSAMAGVSSSILYEANHPMVNTSLFEQQALAEAAGSPRLDMDKLFRATVEFRQNIRELLRHIEMSIRDPLEAMGGQAGSIPPRDSENSSKPNAPIRRVPNTDRWPTYVVADPLFTLLSNNDPETFSLIAAPPDSPLALEKHPLGAVVIANVAMAEQQNRPEANELARLVNQGNALFISASALTPSADTISEDPNSPYLDRNDDDAVLLMLWKSRFEFRFAIWRGTAKDRWRTYEKILRSLRNPVKRIKLPKVDSEILEFLAADPFTWLVAVRDRTIVNTTVREIFPQEVANDIIRMLDEARPTLEESWETRALAAGMPTELGGSKNYYLDVHRSVVDLGNDKFIEILQDIRQKMSSYPNATALLDELIELMRLPRTALKPDVKSRIREILAELGLTTDRVLGMMFPQEDPNSDKKSHVMGILSSSAVVMLWSLGILDLGSLRDGLYTFFSEYSRWTVFALLPFGIVSSIRGYGKEGSVPRDVLSTLGWLSYVIWVCFDLLGPSLGLFTMLDKVLFAIVAFGQMPLHEWGHYRVAKAFGVTVHKVGMMSVWINGEELESKALWKQILYFLGGIGVQALLGLTLMALPDVVTSPGIMRAMGLGTLGFAFGNLLPMMQFRAVSDGLYIYIILAARLGFPPGRGRNGSTDIKQGTSENTPQGLHLSPTDLLRAA